MDAFLLALTTLLGAFGAGPSPEAPGRESTGKPIVFAAVPDPSPESGPQCGNRGDPEIFTVAPDGSDLRRLTTNRLHETTPAWSPGHTHVVFAARPPMHRDPALDDDLFVMRADGTGVRRLTHGPGQDWAPAWSPGGDRIAFVRSLPRRPGISSSNDKRALMLVRADGSGLRRLSPPRRHVGALTPTWAPDGRLAFVREGSPGPVSGVLAGSPGEPARSVVRVRKAVLSFPDWSPDGRWILYSKTRSGRQLERVRADGSRREIVLAEAWAAEPDSPAWSPRGNRIAYTGTLTSCLTHVYRMPAHGDRSRDLLRGQDLEVYSLDW